MKKKGAASFKPRAPVRRPAAPPKPAAAPIEPVVVVASQANAPIPILERPILEQDKPLPSIEILAVEPPSQDAPQPQPELAAVAVAPPALPTPAPTQDSSESTSAAANAQAVADNSNIIPSASNVPAPSPSEPAAVPATVTAPATTAKAAPKQKPLSALARKRAAKAASASASSSIVQEPAAASISAAANEYPDPDEAQNSLHLMPQAQMGGRSAPSTEAIPVPIAPAKPKRSYKRKAPATPIVVDDDETGDAQEGNEEPEIRATKTARKSSVSRKPRKTKSATIDPEDPDAPPKKRSGRGREPTPSDAEEQTIDPTAVKMSDLTKDMRIGKKFSRHEEIEKRAADRKARLKAKRENADLSSSDDDRRRPKRRTRTQTEEPVAAADTSGAGPRMRLVDGQIVIDETSLNLDRHKIAAANAGIMEIVQEDEFTHMTNSATYMKKEKVKFWDYEAEKRFYDGLRQFGTDFEMISMLFKDRSRRHIKLKYNKEERVNPQKITAALIHEKAPIDFEKYQTETGLDFIVTEDFKRELAEVDAKHAEQEALIDAEMQETIRKKKDAIHGREGSEKENEGQQPQRKKGKASKKNKASAYGGGEDIEDLGEI